MTHKCRKIRMIIMWNRTSHYWEICSHLLLLISCSLKNSVISEARKLSADLKLRKIKLVASIHLILIQIQSLILAMPWKKTISESRSYLFFMINWFFWAETFSSVLLFYAEALRTIQRLGSLNYALISYQLKFEFLRETFFSIRIWLVFCP